MNQKWIWYLIAICLSFLIFLTLENIYAFDRSPEANNGIAIEGIMNGVDTSTLIKVVDWENNSKLYLNEKGEAYSLEYLQGKPTKVYHKATENTYTTIMNLKFKWFVNDYIHLFSEKEADYFEKHLTKIYDRFGVAIVVATTLSKEKNSFNNINASAFAKNPWIDVILWYIKDTDEWYIDSKDDLNFQHEDLSRLVLEPELQKRMINNKIDAIDIFKSDFLKLYIEKNPEQKKYFDDNLSFWKDNPNENYEIFSSSDNQSDVKKSSKETTNVVENTNWFSLNYALLLWFVITIVVGAFLISWSRNEDMNVTQDDEA